MGMTIENANKLLSVITSTITEDDDCFTIEDENLQVFKETLLTAIETMRKYQKIKEQVDIAIYKENFAISGARLIQIREIIDGNGD